MGTLPSPIAGRAIATAPVPSPAARRARVVIGAAAVMLLAWLAWQGYRNPDFLLGLAAFRLC